MRIDFHRDPADELFVFRAKDGKWRHTLYPRRGYKTHKGAAEAMVAYAENLSGLARACLADLPDDPDCFIAIDDSIMYGDKPLPAVRI